MTVVLHPGEGPVRAAVYLPATPQTVRWGRLPCAADAAVLEVSPGTEVTVDTVSHEGLLPDQGGDPVRFFGAHGVPPEHVLRDAVELAATLRHDPADGPHLVTGPIRVTGAQPGDVLSVTVVEALPRVPYGVVSNRHGRGALPGELPRTPATVSVFTPVHDGVGSLPLVDGGPRVVRFPAAPFPGIVGVATRGPVPSHSVPPGPHGGNVDVALLRPGATIHLPVQVPGALVYVGDPHLAQGDGEVALTALEASLRLTLRLDVIAAADAAARFGRLTAPLVETPDLLVPLGLDPDLGEAMRACVRNALTLLQVRFGMAEHLAYAYLSAAADFAVTQVVDQVVGVHARIRRADFPAP